LDVEAEEIKLASGKTIGSNSGIRLSIYLRNHELDKSEAIAPMRLYHYGERIRFRAKLRSPRNFRNPGAFDYRTYLYEKGIVMLASTKGESVQSLAGFGGNAIERWRERIHGSIVGRVHALWPADDAALIGAMIVGEDAFIDRDTRADFQ